MTWPPAREFWPEGFTAYKDGWCKWYRSKTRHVCGKAVSRERVAEIWFQRVKPRIDGERPAELRVSGEMTYRECLSEFAKACRHRVTTGKPRPMSERTLWNYLSILNDFGEFVGASNPMSVVNRPDTFARYARRYGGWKSSGFDSVVSRVGALFRWAADMEYIDRYRPGPEFQRPAKSEIRSERIELTKAYTFDGIAKIIERPGPHKLWCWLGVLAGYTNSDVAKLTALTMDRENHLLDFRRAKTGKIRRVCPLPKSVFDDLLELAKKCESPDQPIFITQSGNRYARIGKHPVDSISRLWRKVCIAVGVYNYQFTGLRTTLYNHWPRGYELERKIVMGRAHGTIDLDHYLEDVGIDRLRHCVNHLYELVNTSLRDLASQRASASAQPVDATQAPAEARPASP